MTARHAQDQAEILARAVEAGAFDRPSGEPETVGRSLAAVEAFLGSRLLPSVVGRARALLAVEHRNVPRGKSWRVLVVAEAERREANARRRDNGRFRPGLPRPALPRPGSPKR